MIYGIERRLDGGLAYPGTGDEHSRGRVVGGACWDLRQSGAMSADSTNEMIYRAISYLDVGDDSLKFADLLDALLISDDAWNGIGDNDITNGTPHDDQIFDAFLNDHAILGDFLAGTISENYTITNDTITLISDVSVAASKILTISDGTVIDLNGYKITCGSNGKIVRQGTVEFLPKDIYIKSGSDIISQYSTLSSAFSVFTTGETLVVNDGTHALTDNVTVSSGSTLELKPGTTLQFASGKKLTVNGTLLSVGTGSLITFEASGYGTWYGIDFTSSSSSNNVINSIFEDMTNGLVYTNCSYSNTIYGGEFDNNDISVNIINSSVTLGNCEIQNSDDYGVKCSSAGSMSALTDNIFADNYIGIWGIAIHRYISVGTSLLVVIIVFIIWLMIFNQTIAGQFTLRIIGGEVYLLLHHLEEVQQSIMTPICPAIRIVAGGWKKRTVPINQCRWLMRVNLF